MKVNVPLKKANEPEDSQRMEVLKCRRVAQVKKVAPESPKSKSSAQSPLSDAMPAPVSDAMRGPSAGGRESPVGASAVKSL